MRFKIGDKVKIRSSVITSCDSHIQDEIKGLGKLIRELKGTSYWLVRFDGNNYNYYFKSSSLKRPKNQQLLFNFMD